jgi:sulfite exporter TauE/SafE
MELWTALGLGFFGSFHCVGMCGPIVLSLPRASSSFSAISFNAIIYNLGRILVYAFFGLIFGFLGKQITLAGFQSTLSIVLGVSIILGVLFSTKLYPQKRPEILQKFISAINKAYGILIRKQTKSALFGMGVLNGLLPCAFVYTGLAAAVLTTTPYHSMLYMTLFGLGTLPALFTVYVSPNFISMDLRSSIKKYLPYLAFALGTFLVLRGILLQDLNVSAAFMNTIETFCVFPSKNT